MANKFPWGHHIKNVWKVMDKNLKKFMAVETRSRAQILDDYYVEVQTPDGEMAERYLIRGTNIRLMGSKKDEN